MFLLSKVIPLDVRPALGFRGDRKKRSCFYCGLTEENNFDNNGRLQMLKVKSLSGNLYNQKQSNHLYVCSNPTCKKAR